MHPKCSHLVSLRRLTDNIPICHLASQPALHAAVDRFHAIMQDEKEQTLLLSAVEDAWRPRGAA